MAAAIAAIVVVVVVVVVAAVVECSGPTADGGTFSMRTQEAGAGLDRVVPVDGDRLLLAVDSIRSRMMIGVFMPV